MNLQDRRDQWEKGAEEMLCVTHNVDGYKTVLVVLNFDEEYALHRYFKIGDDWSISIDISNSTLAKCLFDVTTFFEDIRP